MGAKAKGFGSDAYNAKLTEADVALMRALCDGHRLSYRTIAQKFDVSLSTARAVVNYQTWRHVA